MNGIIKNEDTIITPEKAAIVERLNAMRADGWRDLEAMDAAELDALEDDVRAAAVVLNIDHPYNVARQAAYEAIRVRRSKLAAERINAERKQYERRCNIDRACANIRDALNALQAAWDIPYTPRAYTPLPDIDTDTATDAELAQARVTCTSILSVKPRYIEQAAMLSNVKTDAAKAVAKELIEISTAESKRQADVSALLESVEAEISKRADKRAKREAPLEERLARVEALLE